MLTEINITDGDGNKNPVIEFIYLGNRRIAIMTGNADSPCFVATAAAMTGAGVPLNSIIEQTLDSLGPKPVPKSKVRRVIRRHLRRSLKLNKNSNTSSLNI